MFTEYIEYALHWRVCYYLIVWLLIQLDLGTVCLLTLWNISAARAKFAGHVLILHRSHSEVVAVWAHKAQSFDTRLCDNMSPASHMLLGSGYYADEYAL